MTKIQAVLCDLDGLLVDSEPLALQALEQMLIEHGFSYSETIAHQLIGRRAQEGAALLLSHYELPFTPEELVQHHRAQILELVATEAAPMPYAQDMLEYIQQLGLKSAVATSSPRPYLEMVLQKFGWHNFFQATVSGEEVAHGKPAPDIFLRAAELIDTPPQNCMVLEDSPPGARAGLAAGAQVWAVTHAFTERLDFPQGINKVQSLKAVIAWLQQGATHVENGDRPRDSTRSRNSP